MSNGSSPEIALVQRQVQAIRLALVLDCLLLVPILVVAWLANSMVLFSEAFGSLSCLAINGISFLILRRIARGQTGQFEYGAEKMEVVGSVVSSILMLVSAAVMGWITIGRFSHPEPIEPTFGGVGVAFQSFCLVLNVWLWRRNRRIAAETSGPIMEATWRGNRADMFEDLGIIVALVLTLALRPYPWSLYIDPACALVALIYPTGEIAQLLRRSLGELMDKTLEEELQIKILRHLGRHYDQYEDFLRIKSRRAGRRIFIDLYLGFDGDRRIRDVADLIEQLRKGLAEDIPGAEVNVIVSRADAAKSPQPKV